MTGRKALAYIIVFGAAFVIFLFNFLGYESTWRLWNIPTLMPPFTDLRLLPGSAESFRAGYNPIYDNPGDPLGRHFNYPLAWYLVFYTGIDQEDTIWVGAVLAIGYLLCIWLIHDRLPLTAAGYTALVIFSPASMLAIERGNVDLFIFILCVLALLVPETRSGVAATILMAATFLKLFPLFGFAMFLRESRSRFWMTSLSALSLFLVYAVLTYPNISASFAYTEKGAELSYGVNVVPLYMEKLFNSAGLFKLLTPVFSLMGLTFFLSAVFLGGRSTLAGASQTRTLSAFRLGAMVYMGTFVIGNNWDYRLTFLLFLIPQLFEWKNDDSLRSAARWALVLLAVSCWYLILVRIFSFPYGNLLAFTVDQISKWGLFFSVSYLFLASAPDWLKMETRVFGCRWRKLI